MVKEKPDPVDVCVGREVKRLKKKSYADVSGKMPTSFGAQISLAAHF
jgi:hypothetical protein